jgi:N-acetylneuraminate synthase
MRNEIVIDNRKIGPGHPPFIVAEISSNHNQFLDRALRLVELAARAGVDAVKLQTARPETITLDHDGPDFRIKGGPWDGYTLFELYKEAQTPWEWHQPLFQKGRDLGVTVFSSPFDEDAVDFLESLGAPAYKIASFEAVDLGLIAKAARTGKPLIISTGMADKQEIGEALDTARGSGGGGVILLHCISAYPTPPEEANLATISDLKTSFGVPVGLSDHSLGVAIPIAGVALGACFIEKHFTLNRQDGGLDAAFSLEPPELEQLVQGARTAWEGMGKVNYERTKGEQDSAVFRRSLYAVEDVSKGELFTHRNVRSIRPGYGLAPKHLPNVIGRMAKQDIVRGTALTWDLLD